MDHDDSIGDVLTGMQGTIEGAASSAAEGLSGTVNAAPSDDSGSNTGWLPDPMKALSLFQHYVDPVVQPVAQPGAEPTAPADPTPAAQGTQPAPGDDGFMGPQISPDELAKRAQDRKDADAELSGNFKIIDAKHAKGPHGENQVTQAEYEEIRQRYIDIKNGNTDIVLPDADDPGRYSDPQMKEEAEQRRAMSKTRTMLELGKIMKTRSGRALVNRLSNNVNENDDTGQMHFKTTIVNTPAPHYDDIDDGNGRDEMQDQRVSFNPDANGGNRALLHGLQEAQKNSSRQRWNR